MRSDEPFADRHEAGAALAERLGHHRDRSDVVVFGLPRGGVPVAAEVARAMGARATCLDVAGLADEVVCARMPEPFSVGCWYRDFEQTTDDEVCALTGSPAPIARSR
jgi:predicted phosphoribosyltransferase